MSREKNALSRGWIRTRPFRLRGPGWVARAAARSGGAIVWLSCSLVALHPVWCAADESGPRSEGSQSPTNLELLHRAAKEAAHRSLEGCPLAPGDMIGLQARADDPARLFWEETLIEVLASRGFRVVRLAPPQEAPPGAGARPGRRQGAQGEAGQPAGSSAPAGTDSTGAAGAAGAAGAEGSAGMVAPEAANDPALGEGTPAAPAGSGTAFAGRRLRFETLELSMTYPGRRGHIFGESKVERLARAGVFVGIESGPESVVEWTGRGESVAEDLVPGGELKYVETVVLPVPAPKLANKGFIGRLGEPALVVGLVGGLVYLFYANRSEQ